MNRTNRTHSRATARATAHAAADGLLTMATRFAASPLIEACYALAHLCERDRATSLHAAWTEATRRKLSAMFWRRFRETGGWPRVWTVLPDLLDDFDPAQLPGSFAAQLSAMAPRHFARCILRGVIHPAPLVEGIMTGRLSLRAAAAKASAVHREWLLYSGLYPFDEQAPVARTLQCALDSPERLSAALAAMLKEFWEMTFASTWRHARPQYEQSLAQKDRLRAGCTAQRFADELRLRVEFVNDQFMQAVRGGYRLPFKRVGTLWMIPSAFNTQHFWHVLSSKGREHPLFPYFEPSIDIGISAPIQRAARDGIEPPFDPAQIFRALADPARYSMMLLLGSDAARTATELAGMLSLSKGTVSHHVHVMREAGVLTQSREESAVVLRLNRAAIERLSAETLTAIQHVQRAPLRRTRSKQRARAR